MRHKGYAAVLEVDDESGLIFGHVAGIRDVVTFQGATVDETRRSFEESVDFYIDICKQQGDEPQVPFSGRILVRIDPDLHRTLAIAADCKRIELNDLIGQTLSGAFPGRLGESESAVHSSPSEESKTKRVNGKSSANLKKLTKSESSSPKVTAPKSKPRVRSVP
jgi:predicted HicB family RNase H-like nuclease